MQHSYILKYPQALLGNDSMLHKVINNKAVVIFQIWLPIILESFISVRMKEKNVTH